MKYEKTSFNRPRAGLVNYYLSFASKISVQGGTGLTGITKNENYNANFGYRFGVGVEFPIDKTWSMQTGLQLLNRSYSIDEAVTALGITETGKQIYMGLGIDSKSMESIYKFPSK